jgi:RNA polymerase sigma factor (sigma-70 family)
VLSREKEQELLKEYRLSNDSRIKDKLINSNLRYVVRVANDYSRKFQGKFDVMEFIQQGNMGLVMSIDSFDMSKNVRIITYAHRWITAYITNYIRRYFNVDNKIESICDINDWEMFDESHLGLEEQVERKQLSDDIIKVVESKLLTDKERCVITKRYMIERPLIQKDIAEELNISRQRVAQLEKRAKNKLEEALIVVMENHNMPYN